MTSKTIYSDSPPLIQKAFLFFDNHYDIEAKTIIRKINYDHLLNQKKYSQSAFLYMENLYLALVHSDKIIILDFSSGKVMFEYANKYCACFVGDYLLFGTWEKVVIIDNPLLEVRNI